MARVDGIALGTVAAGALFLYAGLKGYSIPQTLQAVVQGKSPAGQSQATPISGADGGGGGGGGDTSAHDAGAAANQAAAKLLAAPYGWSTGQQWDDLVSTWNKESGWSNTADTRESGLDPANADVFAYGIAQARPYSKYPKPGWPPDKGGSADPNTQISWGLQYIAGRYGSPSAAWAHEQSVGWY